MPSSYSPLKIQLMATGENNTTWGDVTNINLGTALEEAIVGSADVAFSNADVTLTLTNTNATQSARNLRLNLTGTATTGYNLILGSGCQIEKPYIVNNATDGTITVKNTTGTGVAVPTGKTMWVYNNGTNVADINNVIANETTISNIGTPVATSVGYRGIPQNTQSADYTLVIADAGKHIYSNNTAVQTVTIPTNASVAFPIGTTITIVNRGTSQILLGVSGVSVIPNGSASATPYPTIAVNNSVQLLKTGTNTWQSTFGTVAATAFSYLSVAGGGGGGAASGGGGGGGGGLFTGTSTLAAGTLTVTVGAGGAVSVAGSNSSITGTTAAVGGGRGGDGSVNIGGDGGSGGGGGGYDGTNSFAGGSGTSGQGFAGGATAAAQFTAGGGGGASAVGGNGNGTTLAGAGGAGLASTITGSSVTYAGGGGGGIIYTGRTAAAGGAGGGGAGGTDVLGGVAGTTNLGGGGGGGGGISRAGAAGGSGRVVISSPIAAASTTGSPTITTSGGNTIYVFNTSGTITFA